MSKYVLVRNKDFFFILVEISISELIAYCLINLDKLMN